MYASVLTRINRPPSKQSNTYLSETKKKPKGEVLAPFTTKTANEPVDPATEHNLTLPSFFCQNISQFRRLCEFLQGVLETMLFSKQVRSMITEFEDLMCIVEISCNSTNTKKN